MKTALIIEDNRDNMKLMTFILEKSGYRTLQAWTGQVGLDVAMTERPDFILLDIQLPDMDGLEVLRRIRDSDIDGGIPVVAVTSHAMAGDRHKMMASGCTGYIDKPIDPRRIIGQIRQIIGERKAIAGK